MPVPVQLPTFASNESYGGVVYHIEGELVPVLHIEISQTPVYFEHHILLWKDPALDIGIKALKGAFKRILSGMPVFMTETKGSGQIAFSRDGAGHVFPMHLAVGQTIDVREHQFLAATSHVEYTFSRVKGVANMLLGGSGFFIDTFHAPTRDGVLWLHGYGNVFTVDLAAGEAIDIEPGGWVFKDSTVTMETVMQKLTTGFFASAGSITFNRFRGPGKVGIQSMYQHMPTTE